MKWVKINFNFELQHLEQQDIKIPKLVKMRFRLTKHFGQQKKKTELELPFKGIYQMCFWPQNFSTTNFILALTQGYFLIRSLYQVAKEMQ